MKNELEMPVSNSATELSNYNSKEDEDVVFGMENFGSDLIEKDWMEILSKETLKIPTVEDLLLGDNEFSICGSDSRILVDSTKFPFRLICKLIINTKNNGQFVGSGFFISPKCIITSGHCIFNKFNKKNSEWAKSVQIIPGANGISAPFGWQTSSIFHSVEGWIRDDNRNYDYGAIILPDASLFRRVKGYFYYEELNGSKTLFTSGYPSDSIGQYKSYGSIYGMSDFIINYMFDTKKGQSGSPVFYKHGTNYKAVGVHGYGGCPNSCIKVVNGKRYENWKKWSNL